MQGLKIMTYSFHEDYQARESNAPRDPTSCHKEATVNKSTKNDD